MGRECLVVRVVQLDRGTERETERERERERKKENFASLLPKCKKRGYNLSL